MKGEKGASSGNAGSGLRALAQRIEHEEDREMTTELKSAEPANAERLSQVSAQLEGLDKEVTRASQLEGRLECVLLPANPSTDDESPPCDDLIPLAKLIWQLTRGLSNVTMRYEEMLHRIEL
jgi:hypothetical protein